MENSTFFLGYWLPSTEYRVIFNLLNGTVARVQRPRFHLTRSRTSAALFFVPLLRLIGKTRASSPLCVANNTFLPSILSRVLLLLLLLLLLFGSIQHDQTIQSFLTSIMEVGRRPVGSFMVRGSWKVRFTRRFPSGCKWERFEWEIWQTEFS